MYLLTGQETDRLRFRLVEQSDFETWIALFKERESAVFLGLDPELSPRKLCEIWFDKAFHRYENGLGGMNALIDKATNELVGQCGLLVQNVEDVERIEIGYSILPKFWKRGYATEAALKCKDFAFTNDYAESLISIIHIDNIGSKKVAIKNGMRIEKSLASYKGTPVNIYGITKATWKEQKDRLLV